MAMRSFTIPIQNPQVAETELNAFLRGHRVVGFQRTFVDKGAASFWAVCVDYADSAPVSAATRAAPVRGRVDYREVLSREEFPVYSKLRELRKTLAQKEGIPLYTVFTNEQLAQMVQKKAATKAALEAIVGVGDGRIEKYGAVMLEFLQAQWGGTAEASKTPA